MTRESVTVLLDAAHIFYPSPEDLAGEKIFMAERGMKAPAKKIMLKLLPISDLVVADANKPFILEHPTAVDDLVAGLLVDEENPRREDPAAAKVQEMCLLVLHNLALSHVGKLTLCTHAVLMASLTELAKDSDSST